MATEFILPELGENIESGDVINILVSEGDSIDIDDPILELETDKATLEVPSSVSGVIKTIHIKVGDTIRVGQVILTAENGAGEAAAPEPEAEEPASEEKIEAVSQPEAEPTETEEVTAVPTTVEFKLPELGENIESGTVVGILVSVGDSIAEEQGVIEIETDKATAEVPAPANGVVKEIHVQDGDEITVGQLILTIEAVAAPKVSAKAEPSPEPEPVPAEPEDVAEAEPKSDATTSPQPAQSSPLKRATALTPRPELGMVPAAPNVRRLAREIGVDLTHVVGSGPDGRISMEDVKRHARHMPAGAVVTGRVEAPPLPDFSKWGQVEREAMSNVRRATAKHLDVAWSTIPHVTQFDKADVTELEQLRKRFSKKVEEAGGRLTITAILLKVVAAALKEFPQFNASVDMANEEIIYKHYYHIGVAVDTDRGLLVPVIRDVDQKNIMELAVELGKVAERARNRKLSLEDMQGGTFSITNLGGLGGTNFTPIVNLPEVAILGIARGSKEPVFKADGQFEPRLMLPLSLSYDHRLIDGADGVRFLRWIVEYLEQPFLTALQGW